MRHARVPAWLTLPVVVNAGLLLALALLAAWLLQLQPGDAGLHHPGDDRLIAAGVSVFVYLVFCAALYWRRRAATVAGQGNGDAAVLVIHASQTGFAEQLAQRTVESLALAAMPARAVPLGTLDGAALARVERALFVVSTTGEGDAPDSAYAFVQRAMRAPAKLSGLQYGLLALGDSGYTQFCGFGRQLDAWLQHQGASPMFDRVEVDNGDAGALRHWQHQLGVITGRSDIPDWQAPVYESWTLAERRLMNPGSEGHHCYHLVLRPPEGVTAQWSAGDIAEVGPDVTPAGERAHREYSIASIPADGAVHLLVRQMRRPDGSLGHASGWLTERAAPGSAISLRIRINRGFHAPQDDVPLILIANGTGLAGLRALIKARIARGHRRNWLLFGEREAACDYYFGDEIDRWRAQGDLQRVDLAFSRDQPRKVYVQDVLRDAAPTLREWVHQGAAIYVCGSLKGMAPAVDAVLRESLGTETLERLTLEGRYRRDVY